MLSKFVAGSNDIGNMHRAEACPASRIFNNEAVATIIGVFVLPLNDACLCLTAKWLMSGHRRCLVLPVNLYTVWKADHSAIFLADTAANVQRSKFVVFDSHIGIMPYFPCGSSFRRLWLYDAIIIGASPAEELGGCDRSNFCQAQRIHDEYARECDSVVAPVNFCRIGFVKTMDRRQSRQLSPAFPKLDGCHSPLDYHDRCDSGIGWMFFERRTLVYLKKDDCGRMDRTFAMGVSGAVVRFPISINETMWHATDAVAEFEMSAGRLNNAFVGRTSPCQLEDGGCMRLDQLLFQGVDGTLLRRAAESSVVPFIPRTQTVWSSQCTNEWGGATIEAMVCNDVRVQLLQGWNLDRASATSSLVHWF
jgi:hypothetical protein